MITELSPFAHAFAAAGDTDAPPPAGPTLREQARLYQAAGFRTLTARSNKTPLCDKDFFGRARPKATHHYQDFPEHRTGGVIILCGALSHGGSRELLGLDRDGEMTWEQLEAELGCTLPPTLSSKGDRHRLYWLPTKHGVRQDNGTLKCEGGALDIRPDHGGYLFEPWQWDGGFDPARIADFPDVEALRRVRGGSAPDTSDAPTGAGAADLPAPRTLADEEFVQLLEAACNAFPAGGGGTGLHDACKALGGACRRAGIERDQVAALAHDVAETVGSESPRTRAAGAVDAWDRCHRGESAFGVPRLRELCGESAETEVMIAALRHLTPKDQWIEAMAEQWLQRGANDTAESESAPEGAPPAGLWRWVEADELATPLAPVEYRCEALGFVLDRDYRPDMIVGPPGRGKTGLAQAYALAVASGLPMFGTEPVKAGVVYHIDNEQGLGATQYRYQLLAGGAHVNLGDLRGRLRVFADGVRLTRGDKINDPSIEALRRNTEGADVVIMDSLITLGMGIDENSVAFAEVLMRLRDITRKGGPKFLVLHHTGKSESSADGRGSSAIDGERGATWVGSKTFTWRHVKKSLSDTTDFRKPFTTRWDEQPPAWKSGKTLPTAQIVLADGGRPASGVPTADEKRIVAALVKEHPDGISRAAVETALSEQITPRTRLRGVIDTLLSDQVLALHGTGRTSRLVPGPTITEELA